MNVFFYFLFICSQKIWISKIFLNLIINNWAPVIIDKTLAANWHIRMISERSRDTEDWSNACNDYVQVLFALFQFFL